MLLTHNTQKKHQEKLRPAQHTRRERPRGSSTFFFSTGWACPRGRACLLKCQAFDFFAAYNTPHFVFVFVLYAVRRRPPRPADEGTAAKSVAAGAPACVLHQLSAHGPHFAVGLKRRIAEFAGVLMRATPRAAHFKAIATAP